MGVFSNHPEKRLSTSIKNLFLRSLLIAAFGVISMVRGTAQTFTTLHNFSETATNGLDFFTNSDGSFPEAAVVLSGNTLYGTAVEGTPGGWGTIFSVNTDGTGFTNLHNFTVTSSPLHTNSDGAFPQADLILSGNTLYGTANNGGSSGAGTIFSINVNGTDFTNLHTFNYSDGATPSALILSANSLYGTTSGGGSSGFGTIFKINIDGSGFTNLYNFTAISGPLSTNSDGAIPQAKLILSGNMLYGTADDGGSSGAGTVFKINTNGMFFKTLHSFTALSSGSFPSTNGDGAYPIASLVLSGTTLYGTAIEGGNWGDGTVFAVSTDGLVFKNLHNFAGYPNDGAIPEGGLILFSNILYGTASQGGGSGVGMVFAIYTSGLGFTTLHSFAAGGSDASSNYTNSDGINPFAGLSFSPSENMLYGTGIMGGISGAGTVFSLALPPPQLTMTRSKTNVVLTWPLNVPGVDYTGFVLQATTNLALPDWNNVDGPSPRTNAISGPQMFYRLKKETIETPL